MRGAMRGQWSLAYALVALAVVAWAMAVLYASHPRYDQIDLPQTLYRLKLESLAASQIHCVTYATAGPSIYCNGSVLSTSGVNRSVLIYYRGGLVAARLSRSWGPINYTLYLALINCTAVVAPNGGVARAYYIALSSTLDYMPELYVNASAAETAVLGSNSGYLAPQREYLLAVSKGPHLEVVDFPVSLVITCSNP
jgi:hypothetical protein